jgi:hypothetical protein
MRWNIAGITVPGVCRDMGIEPTKGMMWSVGQTIVKKYRDEYGALPQKDLRPKTYDDGVHCFAIYPEMMRKVIEEAIKAYGYELARQGDLFAGSDNYV